MKTLLGITIACLVALGTEAAPTAQHVRLRVGGDIPRPLELTPEDIAQMPHQSIDASAHGQSGRYEGVPLRDILERAGAPLGEALRGPALATYLVATGADGYRVIFALAEVDSGFTDRVILLADRRDGTALPANAAPFQIIVPGEKRPARWVRQVVSLEIITAVASR